MNNYHVNLKVRKQGRKNGFRLQMKIDLPCAYPGCEVRKAKEDPPGAVPAVAFQNTADLMTLPLEGTPINVLSAVIAAPTDQLVKTDAVIQVNVELDPLASHFSLVLAVELQRNGVTIQTQRQERNLFSSGGQIIGIPFTYIDEMKADETAAYQLYLSVLSSNYVTQVAAANRSLIATGFPIQGSD